MQWRAPTFADVLEARRRIAPHLRPTPLYRYPALDELVGAEVHVKHENHQPIGAFKVRGGVNLVSQLEPEERERGVITASTGQPRPVDRLRRRASSACGRRSASPRTRTRSRSRRCAASAPSSSSTGATSTTRASTASGSPREHGYRYIHSGNEPLLIAGVATETLEILEEQPGIDAIVVPIGGGSGAAGACIVARRSTRPCA